MTENDKYKPTPAEKKLLEVLLNAENVGKSVQELCNLAGVSRNKYYDAMKKQEFVDLVNRTTMDLIKGKAANVLNAAYNFALTEKGHQDRKMILTIAGIYAEKQETKITGDMKVSNPFANLSEEELRKLASRDG
ncbi:MAG TPA: hypothetical protein IAA29_00555 [Candidatus Paenibacillus intestinavium]|nr:hypothetical protein [Candidatus Paenibacillus intestinavium]